MNREIGIDLGTASVLVYVKNKGIVLREPSVVAVERNTGKVIVDTFRTRGIDPDRMHAVLVCSHGPFTWGNDAASAVEASAVLENVAQLAMNTAILRAAHADAHAPMQQELLRRHFDRKHGPGAYYGQN